MTAEDLNGEARTITTAIGFVAILDPKGHADETLKSILPNLAVREYHTHSTKTLALAADAKSKAVTVRCDDGRDVILLGGMVSEVVGPDVTLDWAVSAIAEERYTELKTLQGVFALIIVDWPKQTVTVVSDLLGVKPFYVATRQGVTILSDRAEAAPRLGGASADVLGIAGWLYFGVPLVNRTMFESVERIAPASVTVFDGQSRRQEVFWTATVAEEPVSGDELADAVYHDFAASLRRLLRPYQAGTVLLSGGFDSRLCLLTASRENMARLDAVTVPYSEAERKIVDELVDLTGIECSRAEIRESIWDEFDSMWFSHPDGFPKGPNLTYLCVTRLNRLGPFIDGSHSDVALRSDRSGPEDGRQIGESEARAYVFRANTRYKCEYYFCTPVLARLERLARQAAAEQSDAIGYSSKFCKLWNIRPNERSNIANNHLQYAHIAPSIQPFYDRALMERRLRHPNSMFTKDSYREMLKRYFPTAGHVPHAKDLPTQKNTVYAFSWALWRQLPSIVGFATRHREVLKGRWVLPRIAEYALWRQSHMYVVKELSRLVKLEQELNRWGIELDFNKLLSSS